ncbi:MAG TPA: NAD(P)/FAD-dependent oxidoreductase [Macromonas sp.]|nr:NAD(P)/FAD-dependent oxidoreductase [Macromonas sp.]
MSKAQYDVVVVGAGSNSLSAAAYLGKAGKRVLVLEKNSSCGGGVVSREFHPGFIGDTHATGMGLCLPNPAIANDELELLSRHGLKFFHAEAAFSTTFYEGGAILNYRDVDRTCATIAQFSPRDAKVYKEFTQVSARYLPLLLKGLYTPPMPFAGFLGMLESSPEGRVLSTAMLRSAWDVVNDLFESPELKIHLLKWVGEMMISPETKGTGIVPYMLMGIMHAVDMSGVVGGSGQMTAALIRSVQAYGGEIRTGADVVKVLNRNGRATGVVLANGEEILAKDAVVASIHPWDLGDLVEGLEPGLIAAAKSVKLSEHGAINQQLALSEEPIWKGGAVLDSSMGVECVERDMEAVRRSFDEYRYGRMPDHLSPLVFVQSRMDKTRAPEGKAQIYLYHFAPMLLADGGLEGWDAKKQEVADAVFDDFCRYTTNIDRSKILGRLIETPLDHHRHSASMKHGDIFGCGTFTSQFMGRRPIPELGQYRVPGAEGLYLTGPFMHPGGTVTLGGRNTAMRMLMDWGVDLRTVFKSL